MAVRKDTARIIMGILALLALLASLNFFGVKVAEAIPNLYISLFTIGASVALIYEVGLQKILQGKIKNDPIGLVSVVIAGMGILAGLLFLFGITAPVLSTIAGIINLVLAVFLIIEIRK